MWRFGAIFIVCHTLLKDNSAASLALHSTYSFSTLPPANVSDAIYSLSTTVWTGLSSITDCASMTMSRCPAARGFLYHSASGQCTSLLWLHQGSGEAVASGGASDAPAGSFYLRSQVDLRGLCTDGFDPIQYSSDGHVSCVAVLSPATTYEAATGLCNRLNGHLASVKTAEKLQMVANIAQGTDMWVGIDDLVTEGVHRWQEDNAQLTTEELDTVFEPGEPNNSNGREHCVHYRRNLHKLNDSPCTVKKMALCETQVAAC